jgi:predicted RNA-binding protein
VDRTRGESFKKRVCLAFWSLITDDETLSMAYYLNLFSPETYEAFCRSDRTISGFSIRQRNAAAKIRKGDKLLCYMTKLSRWVGVMEVVEGPFVDETPIFYPESDPFVLRFRVKPCVWLPLEKTVPIHEDEVWGKLSFTQQHSKQTSKWTGKLRGSLVRMDDQDGAFLEDLLLDQERSDRKFPVDEDEFRKLMAKRVRRQDKDVTVVVPDNSADELPEFEGESLEKDVTERESHQLQALLAAIGSRMGMQIWIPKADRSRVLAVWKGEHAPLLDRLPLNYDETTLKTVEQIDVLWLKGRAIKRAFEVEHTTSVYSGILRMADLLALQPNMDIKLHIVAPTEKRGKVFQELLRPVFSLLERGPLAEICTYLSYDAVRELNELEHLTHLSDKVVEEYEEFAD